MTNLTEVQRQKLVAHFSEVAVAHLIGAEAQNGKLSESCQVFDYELDGKCKSLYIDWRTHAQMTCGRFSYSAEFIESAREYEMVVILDESDFHHCLRWFPEEAESGRFSTSYLEDDDEAIYTIHFNSHRHEV